jgi:diguanylate cyclase (GGDEF)-like protein
VTAPEGAVDAPDAGAGASDGWALEQLTTFLFGLADAANPDALAREAVDGAAEAMEAEVAALVVDGTVVTAIGFAHGAIPDADLLALATARPSTAVLPGIGPCHVSVVYFDADRDKVPSVARNNALIVARTGETGFSIEERNLLRGMSRALALSLQAARVLGAMRERQNLMERLTRIQRSINGRAPLPEVLQAIVDGAADLIGDTVAGLRHLDPNDPDYAVLWSTLNIEPGEALGDRIRVGDGAGGRAISENRLVVMHDYSHRDDALSNWRETRLEAAMAAPVHESGVVVGSLVIGSRVPGRRYSEAEQSILMSFADHVSLALTDAVTTDALHRALEAARHDAMHDELTNLPNRALLRDRLEQAWVRGCRSGLPIALLFLDFDDFKDINDSLGHDAGDKLLVALAGRLADSLRPGDTIARLGGDEFAVLIDNLSASTTAEDVAKRMLEVLTEPAVVNGREVTMRGSVGIAVSDFSEQSSQSLLYSADLAMYEAKRRGGGRYVLYQPDMHQGTLERLDVEQALKVAIASDQLVLHYQPIEELPSGRIIGAEALVRWQHPVRGLLGPIEFVPVAEASGLISGLGEWVLRRACEEASRWPDDIGISVNLSPRQLEQDLPQLVGDVLARTGLSTGRLTLEVTEASVMADSPETLWIIEELHAMGVHLAIDDFGTGHSSLARLRTLPVDELKIDMSFVSGLDVDRSAEVLVSAIVALAHGSGLIAVAEGVETTGQRRRLVELGCDRAQGYLLSRPIDAESIAKMLHGHVLVQNT